MYSIIHSDALLRLIIVNNIIALESLVFRGGWESEKHKIISHKLIPTNGTQAYITWFEYSESIPHNDGFGKKNIFNFKIKKKIEYTHYHQ